MSRIGNNPISIPEGVNIDIQSNKIVVKGKMGELTQDYSDVIFELKDNILIVKRPLTPKPTELNTAFIVLWLTTWLKEFLLVLQKN